MALSCIIGYTVKERETIMTTQTDPGAAARKRNFVISIVSTIVFGALLVWILHKGVDTAAIQEFLENCGPLAPVLFIAISVFSSYVPIVPMGSMGSIGIVLFGPVTAFFYNYATSVINCTLGFWLAKRYGDQMILNMASPKTYARYRHWVQTTKHFTLVFTICMFLPVSPDIILCMLAGLNGMSWGRFLAIILVSRPVSSWAYSTGLLKGFEWILKTLHLKQ